MGQDSWQEPKQTRILLIDDHPLRRTTFREFLLGRSREWKIPLRILEAASVVEADLLSEPVEVAVLGTNDARDVAVAVDDIRRRLPQVAIAVLSDNSDASEVIEALGAGAQGYISTRMEPSVVLHALLFLSNGGHVFPPEVLLESLAVFGEGATSLASAEANGHLATFSYDELTPRQQQVLELLREGRPNKLIARSLGLRESTVKVHVRQIMRRLGVANRTQAALIAVRQPEGDLPPAAMRTESAAASSQLA